MIDEPIIKKKKKFPKKIFITIFILIASITGITYAFFNYSKLGEKNHTVVMGEIYVTLKNGETSLSLPNVFPETKEEALERDDNIVTFTVDSKNTHATKDIYYGISLNYGNENESKTRIKPEDVMIYLECDGEPIIDGVRYNDWEEQRIWVEKVSANTTTKQTKTYTLRMWIDENVIISDTDPNADYPAKTWKDHYVSLKISVDGKMETMNMPLSIETSDTMVENNKAYFIANISNYTNMSTYGLRSNDTMDLAIESTNDNIEFSYKDSLGNEVTEPKETLNLSYPFNSNKNIEVQVFVTPKNDANGETDISITLNKNGERLQSLTKHMNIYGNNFCLNNGFNKLYDCILASDSLAPNVSTAISNIEAKGEPNLNDTAPSYTYVEDVTYDVANVYSVTGYKFYFGDSYEFDSTNGKFRIYNKDGSSVITDTLSDNYINYYTCGGTSKDYTSCGTIYRIDSTSSSGTTYIITQGDKITYKIASSIRSEVGLYKTEDDYGEAYFYRGDVNNNNVLFGGYYWKIIRTNGDNSIRLIYNGTTLNATGNATAINNYTYSQNTNDGTGYSRYSDPTYVGYMYGKNFINQTSSLTTYTDFTPLTKYYFADGYEFDAEKEVFKLKKVNLDPVSGTFTEIKDQYATYPYTCRSTSAMGVCQVLLKVDSWVNETTVKVQYISHSSVDKDGTRTNENSSNAKKQLEDWYETNIVGKTNADGDLITDYIVDGTFCNDRSTSQSGYLLSPTTYYGAYTRLTASNKTATLKCSNDIRDKFSSTTSRGNGLLEYPVALITVDEVVLAGGRHNTKNVNYYLRTNAYYWTMSPSYFHSSFPFASVWHVYSNGTLSPWQNVAESYGLRPVINISPNVLISQGDGTMENPFQLKLA